VRAGTCRSGYDHFLKTGVFDLRAPNAETDLYDYAQRRDSVRRDIETGTLRDAFEHLLRAEPEAEIAAETAVAQTGHGHIDFYGFHTAAGGWFFSGWVTPDHPALEGRATVVAYFENGQISGPAVMSPFYREDLEAPALAWSPSGAPPAGRSAT